MVRDTPVTAPVAPTTPVPQSLGHPAKRRLTHQLSFITQAQAGGAWGSRNASGPGPHPRVPPSPFTHGGARGTLRCLGSSQLCRGGEVWGDGEPTLLERPDPRHLEGARFPHERWDGGSGKANAKS